MLSDRGMRERYWGEFPALRQLFESETESSRWVQPLSTWPSTFSTLRRVFEVAAIVHENRERVLELVKERPELRERVLEDLWHMRKAVQGMAHQVVEAGDRLDRDLSGLIEAAYQPEE